MILTLYNTGKVHKITGLVTVHHLKFFFPNSASETGTVSIIKCEKRVVSPLLGTLKRARRSEQRIHFTDIEIQ
jgi:hypothetical protein